MYNVSKYGVVALSESLRITLAPRAIGVSAAALSGKDSSPGIVRGFFIRVTPMSVIGPGCVKTLCFK